MKSKSNKCSICKQSIDKQLNKKGEIMWDEGHNAEPINNGRCCTQCNNTKVIPARISGQFNIDKIKDVKDDSRNINYLDNYTGPQDKKYYADVEVSWGVSFDARNKAEAISYIKETYWDDYGITLNDSEIKLMEVTSE